MLVCSVLDITHLWFFEVLQNKLWCYSNFVFTTTYQGFILYERCLALDSIGTINKMCTNITDSDVLTVKLVLYRVNNMYIAI